MLVLVKSFTYVPDANVIGVFLCSWCFSEEFLLHSSSWFSEASSLTLLMIMLMRSFSCTPRAGFSQNFLYTSDASFSEKFLEHRS